MWRKAKGNRGDIKRIISTIKKKKEKTVLLVGARRRNGNRKFPGCWGNILVQEIEGVHPHVMARRGRYPLSSA